MPTHHNLETYLDEYIAAAGIRDDGKSPLFRSAVRRGDALTVNPMRQMLMAKQHLDRADIGSGFEEVGSKAVAQGMAWEVSLKPVAFARDLATGFRAAQALGSAWPGSAHPRGSRRGACTRLVQSTAKGFSLNRQTDVEPPFARIMSIRARSAAGTCRWLG